MRILLLKLETRLFLNTVIFKGLFFYVKMSQQATSCYLKSNDKTLKTVYLPHKKSIILGRSPETNIRDVLCSRQQGTF